jgi:hypothetical protein
MRRVSFALALMAVLGFGSLLIESASAQNSNTMNANMKMGGHRRHRKHRKHRRHKMNNKMKNMTGNANH